MHKALTQMNIQLNLVISDITGATGMQIVKLLFQERETQKFWLPIEIEDAEKKTKKLLRL